MPDNDKIVFQPRARLMLLLGDQLIKDAGIAVFELVKNAYDADAKTCTVTLKDVTANDDNASVLIKDDGHGMDLHTIKNIWLEPGTEHRKEQRENGKRTTKYHRLPLGEKGVGRFAVHKLGRHIELVTRSHGKKEIRIFIDWQSFESERYLSNVIIDVTERTPKVFTGEATGTQLTISKLRDLPWKRGRIRQLHRAIQSICSPFETPEHFRTSLKIQPRSEILKDLLTPKQVLEHALFHFTGTLRDKTLIYDYQFTPRGKLEGISERIKSSVSMNIMATDIDQESRKKQRVPVDLSKYKIGDVVIDFHVFDLEPVVLKLITEDVSGLKSYLGSNGGVRVYRDGMRVYDFGEEGNDWLDLGGKRVNVPASRIGNNQILGAVSLSLEHSADLVEKTNREGFVENAAYIAFREAVEFAIGQAQIERNIDKDRIRKLYSRGSKKEPVLADLTELRESIKKKPKNLQNELLPYVDRVESQYRNVQERLLVTASAGLNLTSVMHEIEKAIDSLHGAIKSNSQHDVLLSLAQRLSDMVDGINWLTRKSGRNINDASWLIRQAILNSEHRFRGHGVSIHNGIEGGDPDFRVKCSRRLILASIMNLIDNAIYWLDVKGDTDKRLYVGTSYEVNGKPGIVVADNGTGFVDPPEYLTQPFYTRKPDGIGLGLHIVEMVMKSEKGKLLFPEFNDLTLPNAYKNGAIAYLEFGEEK